LVWWLWFARGLTAVATLLSLYLLWLSGWDKSGVGGCGNTAAFGCAEVLATHWSWWLGLPVSLLGAVAYLATFVTLCAAGPRWAARTQNLAWRALIPLAVAVAGAACWFVGLQSLELGKFCPYCLGAHACALMTAALIIRHIPLGRRGSLFRVPSVVCVRPGTATLLALVGLVGPGLLAAGQLRPGAADLLVQVEEKVEENTAQVQTLVRNARTENPPGNFPEPKASSPASPPKALPRRIVLELFDYTCSHCRALHADMKRAQERYGSQLSVILLPMAMSERCNRFVQATAPGHELACDYARLALAVKTLDAGAFERFHDWLMTPAEPPPFAEARAYAANLVGAAVLEQAVVSARVEAELQANVKLYGDAGQGKLPKLIAEYSHTIISGEPRGQQLFDLLEERAGVVPPGPQGSRP
jgi:uncharacterized membrane protein